MSSIEVLTPQAATRNSIDSAWILADTVSLESAQANLFEEVKPAENLIVPNYLGHPANSHEFAVPSVSLTSPLGNEARLVNVSGTDKRLAKMYKDTVKSAKNAERLVEDKIYEAAIRLLDTNGAEGLHHIHNTVFPHTVYFNAKRGNGVLINVYMTELGRLKAAGATSVPVFGLITATRDKASEYKFFKTIGAANQKGKYTA